MDSSGKNGETAGTEGQGLRVDGIWVTVTEKKMAARRDRRMEDDPTSTDGGAGLSMTDHPNIQSVF